MRSPVIKTLDVQIPKDWEEQASKCLKVSRWTKQTDAFLIKYHNKLTYSNMEKILKISKTTLLRRVRKLKSLKFINN